MLIKKFPLLPLLLFSSLLVIRIPPSLCQHIQCKETERKALLEVKRELVDEYDHLSSWSSDENNRDCCRWRGVRCSNSTGHIVELDLHVTDRSASIVSGPRFIWSEFTYRPLKGRISASVFKLHHLRHLDVSSNDFNDDPIPNFNESSLNLSYLNISWAGLGGILEHQLITLTDLVSLDISYNNRIRYMGDSLAWLKHFSSLEILNLAYTDLGSIKDWIQVVNSLGALTELSLGECSLSSVVPSTLELKAQPSLKVFKLWGNKFTNSIYRWLAKFQANMVHLDLSANSLSGLIPDFLGNISSLAYLNLKFNQFEGGIPKSFGKLCNLQTLAAYSTGLEGNLVDLVSNLSGCAETSLKTLDLSENQLYGLLPHFRRFSSLRTIDLSFNQLHGPIPDDFFWLSKLVSIWLDGNNLSGSLPDVTKLSSLQELYVRDNKLNGRLPESIGNLTELELLDLSGNNFNDSISESHFANLSKLRWLDLSGNSISLNFKPNYTPPFHLDIIRLGSCHLGPEFPKWLSTQKNCFELNISNAGINDTIPTWFWSVSSRLVNINFSSNSLHGRLPDLSSEFFGNLSGIDLSSNLLDGPLPFFPQNTTLLKLSRNKFSGNILSLCSIRSKELKFLDLSENALVGQLPDCFNQWESLNVLNLADNSLSGVIPTSIDALSNLGTLDLHNNSFNGTLPSTLRSWKSLQFLDLSYNMLQGQLPGWIGEQLNSLIFLNLRFNAFNGSMPNNFCRLNNTEVLDLSGNKISGAIPKCLHQLSAMKDPKNLRTSIGTSFVFPYLKGYMQYFYGGYDNRAIVKWKGRDYIYLYRQNPNKATLRWKLQEYLSFYGGYFNKAVVRWKGREYMYGSTLGLLRIIDFSSNNLQGNIPEEITELKAVVALNLSRNKLGGGIPRGIGKLSSIESLDLSRNHLSGNIPKDISHLNFLSSLDLSHNNLGGKIPMGTQVEGLNASSFEGNSELCGPPLSKRCQEDDRAPSRREEHEKEENEDEYEFAKWVFMGIAPGFVLGFVGICVLPNLRTSWSQQYQRILDALVLKLGMTN